MWNSEAIFSLLEKVRKEDVLWNIKHPLFHKKTMKRSLFDKISAELKSECPQLIGLTTADVMDKFKYVRGQYQKILRKIRNAPSGSAAETPKKWEYFNACTFMQSVYDTCPTQSSFIHPDDLETQREDVVLNEGLVEDLEDVDIRISPCSMTSSTPSPLPDISELIKETPHHESLNQATTSYDNSSTVSKKRKRKINKTDAMDEKMSKTIDHLEKAWAEQSMTHSRFDFATETVMSAMKFFASDEDLQMEFTMEIIELVAAKMRKFKERREQCKKQDM